MFRIYAYNKLTKRSLVAIVNADSSIKAVDKLVQELSEMGGTFRSSVRNKFEFESEVMEDVFIEGDV